MSIKSYKYRFYPTSEQEKILARTFGCVRVAWNQALAFRKSTYERTGKGPSYGDTSANLTKTKKTEEFNWLSDASCVPLQQTLRHLNTAYVNFFKGRARYPRFKNKRSKQSAEYTRSGFKWNGENRSLFISKLGKIKIRWSREFTASPSTVTISRTSTGKYFVSIRIDEPDRAFEPTDKQTGIDLGIAHLATLSDGRKFDNHRITKRFEQKLRRAQKELNRRKKGSNRRKRSRKRVALIHERIANCRRDALHKMTTKLVSENQTLAVENLAVKNMLKNRCLAKAIADCGWHEFVRQLRYKSEWYGRTFVQVSRWEPTSKMCSNCGQLTKLSLSDRRWTCDGCDAEHDRDHNAAKNILAAGLAVTAQGETVNRGPASTGNRSSLRTANQLEHKA